MSVQVSVESLSKCSWTGCPSAHGIPTEIEVQDPEALAIPWYQELGFNYTEDGRLVIQVNA